MDAASIVRHLIDRDRTAGALVGVNADMRVLVIGFYRNKPHRFAACGTPWPVESIRVGECVRHFEDFIHRQSHPRI